MGGACSCRGAAARRLISAARLQSSSRLSRSTAQQHSALALALSVLTLFSLPPSPQVKPFIKVVNYTHLMPTRYALEVERKSVVTTDLINGSSNNPTARQSARKEVKKMFEEKYNSSLKTGKNKWFFQKLRF